MSDLLRDEATLPVFAQTLAGYRRCREAARKTFMAGRAAISPGERQARAVLRHALAIYTWRSLAIGQVLEDQEIVLLMLGLETTAEEDLAS